MLQFVCICCLLHITYIFIQKQLVAIKLITESPLTVTITQFLSNYKTSTASYQMIRKEVSFLSSLHHKNLTQLCGVCTNPFMLLIELAPLGSLRSVISDYQTANAAISSPVLCQSIQQVRHHQLYVALQVHIIVDMHTQLGTCFILKF